MALKTAVFAALACASLLGCAKVASKIPGFGAKDDAPAPAPKIDLDRVPRSELAKGGQGVIRVKVPTREIDTLLVLRDNKPPVQSWRTGDGILFSFRDGLLIETRGLGFDLMSASVPTKAQISAGGNRFTRSYFYMSLNDQVARRDYSCVTEDRGPAQITVQGQGFQTRHVAEICERAEGYRFTNEYWLDGGVIRRSVQWAGPEAGSIQFSRVID